MILDFDDVIDVQAKKKELIDCAFILAVWVSPSGNGVKALAKIADPKKHREHFEAIREIYPEADRSGINISRVCFESYDPEIIVKEDCDFFTKYKITETFKESKPTPTGNDVFEKLLKWLSTKNDAFVTGNRNLFVFKLASACCRFGMGQLECQSNMVFSFLGGSTDFSIQEADQAIKSAYRSSSASSGTAHFTNDVLVTKTTTKEVEIDSSIYDLEVRPKDVVFGEDCKQDALNILRNGYPKATSLHMGSMDKFFKWKRGEITCLTGIGNMGKSSLLKQLLLMQVICEGAKIAIFAPEDFPAHEYYHELTEMYLGVYCSPESYNKPTEELYEAVYDYISEHFFFIYSDSMPTVSYVKERFLELVIKKKVTFCILDPFNQLTRGDLASLRDDQYLEYVLADLAKFARDNNQNLVIVAHPGGTGLKKNEAGDFIRPDVNNIAGGPMWNNKMDNILVYHRPFSKTEPENPSCEFESTKIRRQKVVGRKGICLFERDGRTQRYTVDGIDWMQVYIDKKSKVNTNEIIVENFTVDVTTGEMKERIPFWNESSEKLPSECPW